MAPSGKIVLVRINNESKRKETLRKRKSGLVKKVSELATLCDAEAAIVVYSPGDNQPTVWPSTSEARATISKFLSRPETERMANSHTARSSHSPQVFPPALQVPPAGQAASGLNMNGLTAGRNFPSPAAAHGKLDASDMTPLAPVPFSLPMHNPLIMSPNNSAANRLIMTRRLHGQTKLGGMMQQGPRPPQVPHPALQMPTGPNMNGFSSSINFPSSAAAAHGQHMNLTGMTQRAPSSIPLSLPTANPLVMSPNDVAAISLNMAQRFDGQTNLGGMRQHPLPSPLSMPPTLSTVPIVFSAGAVQEVTDYSLIQRGPPPYKPLELPRRLGLPPTLPTQYEASGSNMIKDDHRWNTNAFQTPTTAPLDQSNSDDGTSIGLWIDGGAAYEVNNAPPFEVKW